MPNSKNAPSPVASKSQPPLLPKVTGEWRHIKSGQVYEVICVAFIEADLTIAVVYKSPDGHVWIRPYAEFTDGRFEQITRDVPSAPADPEVPTPSRVIMRSMRGSREQLDAVNPNVPVGAWVYTEKDVYRNTSNHSMTWRELSCAQENAESLPTSNESDNLLESLKELSDKLMMLARVSPLSYETCSELDRGSQLIAEAVTNTRRLTAENARLNRAVDEQHKRTLLLDEYREEVSRLTAQVAERAAERDVARRAIGEDDALDALDYLTLLRGAGWRVACHNDYRQHGQDRTFWLFTHPDGRWTKGEGVSDGLALAQARDAALASPSPAPSEEGA